MAGTASFADNYKLGGLNPTPEIVGLRKPAFDKLLKELNSQQTLELLRLYYALPLPAGIEWFRAAFAEADQSFTLVDNEREVTVLAGCLLSGAIDRGDVGAILGVLAGAAGEQRTPTVLLGLVPTAREVADALAVSTREATLVKKPFTQKPRGAYSTLADALATAGDWPKASELMKTLGDEAFEGTKNSLSQSNAAIPPLVTAVEVLQEQVNILWWLIGGYSRALDVPFPTLIPGLAGIMAGLDAASLSVSPIGPIATPALVGRLLGSVLETETSLADAVDHFPRNRFDNLALGNKLASVSDLCPVLGALQRARDVGPSPSWVASYTATTKLDPAARLKVRALSTQTYVEALFLKWLG